MRYLLFISLFFFVPIGLVAQAQNADTLRKKATVYSVNFQLDSAMIMHQLAADQYLIQGDSDLYYRSQADISYELLRSNKLEESEKLARQVVSEGARVMSPVNLASAYRMVAHSNNLLGNREEALKNYSLTLKAIEGNNEEEAVRIRAVVNSDMGIMNYYAADYAQAEHFWKKALETLRQLEIEKVPKNYCEISLNLTAVLKLRSAHYEALKVLDRAEEIATTYLKGSENMLAYIYSTKGDLYDLNFSSEKSTDYYLKAKKVMDKYPPNQSSVFNLINLAYNLAKSGDTQTAIQLSTEALEKTKQVFGPKHEWVGISLMSMSNAYEKHGDIKRAEELVRTSIDFLNSIDKGYYPDQITNHNNLAGMMLRNNRFEEGIGILKPYVVVSDSVYKSQGPRHASVVNTMAELYYGAGQLDSAAQYFQYSLISNTQNFENQSLEESPQNDIYLEYKEAFRALLGKSTTLLMLYEQRKATELLLVASKTLKELDQLSMITRQSSASFADQLTSQNFYSESKDIGFKVAQKLYAATGEDQYLEEAFYYAESGKGNLTLTRLQESVALDNIDVPKSMLELNDDLLKSIAYYEQELYNSKGYNDSLGIVNANTQLASLRLKNDSLKRVINENHPGFYELKFDNDFSSLSSIQSMLSDKQTLYSFDLSDTVLYVFQLQADKVKLHTTIVNEQFRGEIKAFTELITRPTLAQEDIKKYLSLSEKLIEFLLPELPTDHHQNEILIIPDEIISTVPFEALAIGQKGDRLSYGNLTYLIEQFEFHYANSATLWSRQEASTATSNKRKIAAFAPVFDEESLDQVNLKDTSKTLLGLLAFTEKEVENIALHFDTKRFLGSEANERQFRETVDEYDVVHIASHGLLNADDPLFSKLVFSPFDTDSVSDGYLSIQELYTLKIPAEMVVLSACNSGSGQFASGEGLLSLANGFFYAGSRSLVMSLWTANDENTAKIIGDFYSQLAEGSTKSAALRKAKLKYLAAADDINSHPFHWAHLVVNGSDRPITRTSNYLIYLLIFVAVGAAAIGAARKRRA